MTPNPTKDFLGSGWSFPPRLDSRGRITLAHEEQDIEEAIRLILETRKGERPMRPEFGCDLHRLMFQPCDAAAAGQARRYVTEALRRWEPRIDEVEVEAEPDVDGTARLFHRGDAAELDLQAPGRLLIRISYRVAATNSVRNLVYPFYTILGED